MNPIHHRTTSMATHLLGVALCMLALAAPHPNAAAQAAGGSHAGHGTASPAAAAPASAEWAEAEVRRVDAANGRVTLRHGPIRNLDMPPMTMVFHVRDPGLLAALKNGDKIRFQAVAEGGKYVLTQIDKQP
jgi:Cu(I)/Ag(I) efflux system protein CusF